MSAPSIRTMTGGSYKIWGCSFLLLSGILIIASWLYPFSFPRIGNVALLETQEHVELPFKRLKSLPGRYHFTATLHYRNRQASTLHITPDDCLEALTVNGRNVDISHIPQARRCDYMQGFHIDLEPYLHEGENALAFEIKDYGGALALDAAPVHSHRQFDTLARAAPAILLSGFFLTYLLRRWQADGLSIFLVLAAAALYAFQFHHTTIYQYSHDMGGHLDYIKYIAREGKVPPPTGWQTHHAPLYYIVCAVIYRISEAAGMGEPITAVRYFSFVLYLCFILTNLLILRRIIDSKWAYYLSLSMLLFWPVGVTLGARINDDIAFLVLFSTAFYCLLRWHEHAGNVRWFWRALLASGAAAAVKGTGLIALALTGLLAFWHLRHRTFSWRLLCCGKGLVILAVVILLAGVNFGRIYYYQQHYHRDVKWLINVSDQWLEGSPLRVQNKPYAYLVFDYEDFVREPFMNPYADAGGRQYFWNTFLKTLLFGEWHWKAPEIASLLSFCLLLLIFYVMLPAVWRYCSNEQDRRLLTPYLLAMSLMVGALMLARINVPIAAQADARYIFPVTGIFCALYMQIMQGYRQKKQQPMFLLGGLIGGAFAMLSLAFVLLQYAS